MSKTGLLISRDLFFASKVTGTAQALGLTVRCVGPDAITATANPAEVGLVILDLDCPGAKPEDIMAVVSGWPSVATIAFGPHVHEAKLEAARQAGFQDVMPRSKFSANLSQLLQASLS